MIIRKIGLNKEIPNKIYTELCNICERQGVFMACGSPEDKWIQVQFENEVAYLAWLTAMGLAGIKERV